MSVIRLSAPFAAFLALLLLAPGAARAADECGALNSGNSFTENCPNAAYANGIIYWNQANAVTLTVPGTATTTTVTAAQNGSWYLGILVGNAAHATARNIALTVGGTGTSVAIVEATTPPANLWYINTGILVRQRSGGEATTTVDVKSGVTIGTSGTGKMNNRGIDVHVEGTGAGAVSVTSGATIYSANHAIQVTATAAAAGAVTVTNSGTIVTDGRGIYVDYGGSAGAVTVTNSGAITSEDTSTFEGIYARTTGKDAANTVAGVTITHSAGAISVARGGVGIKAHVGTARQETDTEHASYVEPVNAGLAKVAVTGGSVTSKGRAVEAVNYEAGSVVVEVSDGAKLTSTGGFGIAAMLTDVGNTAGTVSVTSAGDVTASTQSAIHARNVAGNGGAVTVMVTGGEAKSEGQSRPAVEVLQEGTGDAVAEVSSGATLTSKHNAGIYANLRHADNDEGQVKITQGGTIAARKGVYARVGREGVVTIAAGTTTRETRAAADQPVIDVTWTGGFSHGASVSVAQNDDDRFLARDVAHAIAIAQEVETEKALRGDPMNAGETGFLRYGSPAGIEAQVMSWRAVMTQVAKGDDPGAFANAAAVTALFDDGADAATKTRAAAIIAAFRTALTNADLDEVPGAAAIDTDGTTGLSDDEIETYLSVDDDDRRALLRNVLAQSFTDAEKAVLRAVATNEGLDAALDDEDAGFSDGYKEMVKALLNRYNPGDIRIAVGTTAASTTGSIVATRGDGIRAYYATQNDMNGAISVTVAAGTTVTGGAAGIYVANAGATGTGMERILKQTVTVNGQVTGGTDAAVHLVGGGTLTVGAMGKVLAGSSGRAILVNAPGRSTIIIRGEVRGGSGTTAAIETSGGGAVLLSSTGRVVLAEGASNAIRVSSGTRVALVVDGEKVYQENADTARARLGGNVVGLGDDGTVRFAVTDEEGLTGMGVSAPLNANGTIDTSDIPKQPEPPAPPPMDMACGDTMDGRCRLYEALPSALLSMNGLPTYRERMSSARGGNGGWARVDTAAGKWKASRSTQDDVSYNRSRTGVRAGVDMAVGEEGLVGLSAHGLTGSAKMTGNGGKVTMTGIGMGINATARTADGIHIDGQLAVTRYKAKLTSGTGTVLENGAKGTGYALALEAGRSMSAGGGVSVTPRAGLAWSSVSLRGFTDSRGTAVSMKNAGSFTGAVGLDVETAPAGGGPVLFGSLDVTREFTKNTETRLPGTMLKATAAATSLRVGAGARFDLGDGASMLGTAAYETAGGGNSGFGGALSFTASF